MVYFILKYFIRTGLHWFCRRMVVNDPAVLRSKGPFLLACNHPNSFLDAVILDTLFDEPIHSLARGDVFINPMVNKILKTFKILPVFRPSEGVENLNENYKTFDSCLEIFRKGGNVLIFSEGLCINEWHLRPLRKGTARLAVKTWEQGIPLRVIPVGINYSSFHKVGKNVLINFGKPIEKNELPLTGSDGNQHQQFNELLKQRLQPLVWEISAHDPVAQQRLLVSPSWFEKGWLALPAVLGKWLHAPLYIPLYKMVHAFFENTGHKDSVLMALLIITYPVYVALISLSVALLSNPAWGWLTFAALPFCAWSYIQLKNPLDEPRKAALRRK